MAYFLEALLTRGNWLRAAPLPSCARIVPLPQGVFLIPVTDELVSAQLPQVSPPGASEKPVTTLPHAFESWVRGLSRLGPIAFVEAQFSGGQGGQCASIWLNEKLVLGPLCQHGVINLVLRTLGVEKAPDEHDEFDTVGLGRHRHTADWK